MIVICAWCGKLLRWVDSLTPGISHGLCKQCYKREVSKLFRRKEMT